MESTKNPLQNTGIQVTSSLPKKRHEILKWNGWGYKDTYFTVRDKNIYVEGNRYAFNNQPKHNLTALLKDKLNLDLSDDKKQIAIPMPSEFPKPVKCDRFLQSLKEHDIDYSSDGPDRIYRSHGQCFEDIFAARTDSIARIPDLVIWPTCHDHVEKIVEFANVYNVMLIPFGGGTNASMATTCPEYEKRAIAALDTSQMNRMLWIDKKGLLACFESGIVGQDLERVLNKEGLTMGHDPDSSEFSTLGGWIATRAAGMKQSAYGNIEDIVVNIKMVTSKGVLAKSFIGPRVSCGPDFQHLIFGSEGTLGVVTEVVVKLRPIPEIRKNASFIFANFSTGLQCLRKITKKRIQPANTRLFENTQFNLGLADLLQESLVSNLKARLFLNFLKFTRNFDRNEMVFVSMIFEGEKRGTDEQGKRVCKIIKEHGGYDLGKETADNFYLLLFSIAYQRDLILDYGCFNESFETSCPWEKVLALIQNVISCTEQFYKKNHIEYRLTVYRVSQVYDTGCCIYFYTGFNVAHIENSVELLKEILCVSKKVIMESGGSLSHHHGIGKLKSKFYKEASSDVGVKLYKAIKHELDPKNIFGVGNLVIAEDYDEKIISHKL